MNYSRVWNTSEASSGLQVLAYDYEEPLMTTNESLDQHFGGTTPSLSHHRKMTCRRPWRGLREPRQQEEEETDARTSCGDISQRLCH